MIIDSADQSDSLPIPSRSVLCIGKGPSSVDVFPHQDNFFLIT